MEELKIELKWIVLAGVGIVVGIIFFMSWQDVDPGEEGFIYRPYGNGIDTEMAYGEGTQFIAPWNEMITYNVLQQSQTYKSTVMDKNGTDITVEIAVNYSVMKGNAAKLHLKWGDGYITFINDQSQGAIKEVIGQYTYEEVYSTKRNDLQDEIVKILKEEFSANYFNLNYVKIMDVDLPLNIANEIVSKETQKQTNLVAKEKQKEEEYKANARIEKARGDTSLVVSARFKAEAISLEAAEISKNPQYIELKKWEKWNGIGSPYGTGNVFGNNAISILKQ
jgi:regulator of protease activity HflC (stomatin/prohibitin superfamily)